MDKSYEERSREASTAHQKGLERVASLPEPTGQKFPVGSRVFIKKDLPVSQSHFPSGKMATVKYTYAHAYGKSSDRDEKIYCLDIDGVGEVSWYHEDDLTMTNDLEREKEIRKQMQELQMEFFRVKARTKDGKAIVIGGTYYGVDFNTLEVVTIAEDASFDDRAVTTNHSWYEYDSLYAREETAKQAILAEEEKRLFNARKNVEMCEERVRMLKEKFGVTDES